MIMDYELKGCEMKWSCLILRYCPEFALEKRGWGLRFTTKILSHDNNTQGPVTYTYHYGIGKERRNHSELFPIRIPTFVWMRQCIEHTSSVTGRAPYILVQPRKGKK
jgi:hypothetical protein